MAQPPPETFKAFFSFEWNRGLGPAQVLHASISAACPEPSARLWFALHQNAASCDAMRHGVETSGAFVFFATEGALLKANVRHEVACAMGAGAVSPRPPKRVIVLLDTEPLLAPPGAPVVPSLGALLTQADGYVQRFPDRDAAAGRLHLDAAGLAAFGTAARAGPCLLLYRDARLLTETLPALLSALGLIATRGSLVRSHRPFLMPSPAPQPGDADALVVSGESGAIMHGVRQSGAMQALYLACNG